MSELRSMKNIGKEMSDKLICVGIDTAELLTDIGAKEAFCRLKAQFPNVCLVHLYTLEGAIQGVDFNALSETTKKDLATFAHSLKS